MDFYVHIYNTFPVEVLLFGFPFFSADRCENKYTHSHLSTPHSYSHSPTFSLAYSLYFVLDRTRHISRAHSELSLSSCFCLFCDSVSKKFIFGGYPAWEKPTDMRQSVPPKEMGWMCVCVWMLNEQTAKYWIIFYPICDVQISLQCGDFRTSKSSRVRPTTRDHFSGPNDFQLSVLLGFTLSSIIISPDIRIPYK